jgi:hypothetical protein
MANDKRAVGWYRNEKGELCFEGVCFGLRANSDGEFDFQFDEKCDLAEATEGQKKLMVAALAGKMVLSTRKVDR